MTFYQKILDDRKDSNLRLHNSIESVDKEKFNKNIKKYSAIFLESIQKKIGNINSIFDHQITELEDPFLHVNFEKKCYFDIACIEEETKLTRNQKKRIKPEKHLENKAIQINSQGNKNTQHPEIQSQKTTNNDSKAKCKCTKSRCLKMYCECYSKNSKCVDCDCQGCNNTTEPLEKVKKIVPFQNINTEISTGCFCLRSGCTKKYCECYQRGALCTALCKCIACKNFKFPASKKKYHLKDIFLSKSFADQLQYKTDSINLSIIDNCVLDLKPAIPGTLNIDIDFELLLKSPEKCGSSKSEEDEFNKNIEYDPRMNCLLINKNFLSEPERKTQNTQFLKKKIIRKRIKINEKLQKLNYYDKLLCPNENTKSKHTNAISNLNEGKKNETNAIITDFNLLK